MQRIATTKHSHLPTVSGGFASCHNRALASTELLPDIKTLQSCPQNVLHLDRVNPGI